MGRLSLICLRLRFNSVAGWLASYCLGSLLKMRWRISGRSLAKASGSRRPGAEAVMVGGYGLVRAVEGVEDGIARVFVLRRVVIGWEVEVVADLGVHGWGVEGLVDEEGLELCGRGGPAVLLDGGVGGEETENE